MAQHARSTTLGHTTYSWPALATTGLLGVAAGLLLAAAWEWIAIPEMVHRIVTTGDALTYRSATLDWLAGRGFYEGYQLAGPYEVVKREIMYPPTILPILVPLALAPAPLWWIVPTAIVAAVAWHWRPGRIGIAVILLCLAWPPTIEAWLNGNPAIFAAAAVALGTRWPAAAPWVLLKPVFAPLALIHVTRRGWWIGLAAFAAVSLAFLPMWPDYITVLLNARPASGPLYALEHAPLVLIPVVAWLGRRRDLVAEPAA